MKPTNVVLPVAIGASVLVSGAVHAYLYVRGYRAIPIIGPSFLLQASVFGAMAVLILIGAPLWMRLAAGAGALGSLTAFVLSRTVGVFGFAESGWQPSPYALISVVSEILAVALIAVDAVSSFRASAQPARA
jgi:hypothetical protein